MLKHLFRETPLVFLTLAIQLATGMAIATTVAALENQAAIQEVRLVGNFIFSILVVGVSVSLLHLGRPLSAWRALSNFPRSRLSLEIVLTSIFTVLSFFYGWALLWHPYGLAKLLGIACSMVGLATVFVSGLVYRVEGRPIWNSNWIMLSFAGSTACFCAMAMEACRIHYKVAAIVLTGGVVMLIASSALFWFRATDQVRRFSGPWLVAHLISIGIFPVLLLTPNAPFGPLLAIIFLPVGIVLGRYLMLAAAEVEPKF